MGFLKTQTPKAVRYLNTIIALALYAFAAYHFTQPNAAWRSGTIETVTATCLLAATYLLPLKAAFVIHLIFVFFLVILGIRHEAIGHGYVSGTVELLFAAALVYGAVIINRERKSRSAKS